MLCGAWNALTGSHYSAGALKYNNNPLVGYRPQRAAIRFKNLSLATSRQGSITVLNTTSLLEIQFVPGTYDISRASAEALTKAVEENPKSKQYIRESPAIGVNE